MEIKHCRQNAIKQKLKKDKKQYFALLHTQDDIPQKHMYNFYCLESQVLWNLQDPTHMCSFFLKKKKTKPKTLKAK